MIILTLSMGHSFFSIFDNSRENNGQAFSGQIALRLYNCYTHMWLGQGPWPYSNCCKTVDV